MQHTSKYLAAGPLVRRCWACFCVPKIKRTAVFWCLKSTLIYIHDVHCTSSIFLASLPHLQASHYVVDNWTVLWQEQLCYLFLMFETFPTCPTDMESNTRMSKSEFVPVLGPYDMSFILWKKCKSRSSAMLVACVCNTIPVQALFFVCQVKLMKTSSLPSLRMVRSQWNAPNLRPTGNPFKSQLFAIQDRHHIARVSVHSQWCYIYHHLPKQFRRFDGSSLPWILVR